MDYARAVVLERGLLTVSDEVWDLSVCGAEVIGELDGLRDVNLRAADEAAPELGVSRRQVG